MLGLKLNHVSKRGHCSLYDVLILLTKLTCNSKRQAVYADACCRRDLGIWHDYTDEWCYTMTIMNNYTSTYIIISTKQVKKKMISIH